MVWLGLVGEMVLLVTKDLLILRSYCRSELVEESEILVINRKQRDWIHGGKAQSTIQSLYFIYHSCSFYHLSICFQFLPWFAFPWCLCFSYINFPLSYPQHPSIAIKCHSSNCFFWISSPTHLPTAPAPSRTHTRGAILWGRAALLLLSRQHWIFGPAGIIPEKQHWVDSGIRFWKSFNLISADARTMCTVWFHLVISLAVQFGFWLHYLLICCTVWCLGLVISLVVQFGENSWGEHQINWAVSNTESSAW